MREIKFRAWNKYMNDMSEVTWISKRQAEVNGFSRSSLDDLEIMQYTGLKDKNGVEIYESDLIEDGFGIGHVEYVENRCAFRINFNNGKAKWFIDYLHSEMRLIEVIGNIYENPELLETT